MTAKEMFEELGYEAESDDDIIHYKNDLDNVMFYIDHEEYTNDVFCVDSKLHKAITQQMSELGWLDD